MQLKGITEPPSTSFAITTSAKFIAAGYGSKGNIVVLPVAYEQYKRTDAPHTISAHGGELTDLAFSPFDDGVLATSGKDNTLKIWNIPAEGLASSLSTPVQEIKEVDGGALCVRWHPSASNVLAMTTKNKLAIVDVKNGTEKYAFKVEGYGKDLLSVAWNYNGSKVAVLGKHGVISVFDPREAKEDVLAQATKLTTVSKPQHVFFLGNHTTTTSGLGEFVAVVGIDKMQRQSLHFFNTNDLSKPIASHSLSLSTGFALPLYDAETEMLLLTARGSQSLTLFDVAIDKKGPAFVQTHQFATANQFKGVCLMPKRTANINQSEIIRLQLLGTDSIEPHGVRVPRKMHGFHAELYPPTAHVQAAMTGEEWMAGSNKNPLLEAIEKISIHSADASEVASPSSSPSSVSSPVEEVKSPTYVKSTTRSVLDSKFAQSIYRHATGHEPNSQHLTWYDLQLSESMPLNLNLSANNKFIALPWKTGGGSAVAILDANKPGRAIHKEVKCVRGHKSQVIGFELNKYDEGLLATASPEGTVRVVRLPEGGLKADIESCEVEFVVDGKVSFVRWHPYVADVLVVGNSGYDGHQVHFYDVKEQSEKLVLTTEDWAYDISFGIDGKLVALACKDKKVRIMDPRENKLVGEFSPAETDKDARVLFVSPSRLVTLGMASGGRRSFSLWDMSDLSKPLVQEELPRNNYATLPNFDYDTNILNIANNGGSQLHQYQIKDEAPYYEALTMYQSPMDVVGQVFLHKTTCDVKKVEIGHSLKLSKDKIVPVTWKVPRKRVEFFQDDLFPPTRANKPLCSAKAWFDGENGVWEMIDLRPSDMTPLSEAPAEEKTELQKRYDAHLASKEAVKPKSFMGHTDAEQVKDHFRQVAQVMPTRNRWDAQPDTSKEDVAEDEWD